MKPKERRYGTCHTRLSITLQNDANGFHVVLAQDKMDNQAEIRKNTGHLSRCGTAYSRYGTKQGRG